MLFVYLFALCLCVPVFVGSVVLLTVPGVWCMEHTITITLLVDVIALCSWAIHTLFKATHNELVCWL